MIPAFIISALEQAGYESPYHKRIFDAFIERWGNFELKTFIHALQEGQGVDKLLAIFVIGSSDIAQICELLLPGLRSPHSLERWASALCLGKVKEEQAIPILTTMLSEFLPPDVQLNAQGYFEWRYDNWRSIAARRLGEWGRPSLAPLFQEALFNLWQQEQSLSVGNSLGRGILQKRYWRNSQYELAYALGQLEKFEMVSDLAVPQSRLNEWTVYLALGYLKARTYDPGIFQTILRNKVIGKDQVFKVLEDKLSFSREQQEQCWMDFKESKLNRGIPIV